ncbi:MAG TPA: hypothetical protein VIX90_03915 [Edaphobacter sp.]
MTLTAFMLFALAIPPARAQKIDQPPAALAHVSNSFRFIVQVPLGRIAPLFGPDAERSWAGKHWDPEFLYPQPAKDIQGAVFTIQHGPHKAIWINTLFDLAAGRMQYVYVIPGVLATTVDVKLTPVDASATTVDVTYVRTALQADSNDKVQAMGEHDSKSGPEWQQGIEGWLKDHPEKTAQ